jgi:hypothetical protein
MDEFKAAPNTFNQQTDNISYFQLTIFLKRNTKFGHTTMMILFVSESQTNQ